jgi:hypothetical protein
MYVSGVDMNRDGVPDVLQGSLATPVVPAAVPIATKEEPKTEVPDILKMKPSEIPLATVGVDTTGDGRPNMYVTGVDMSGSGVPDALQTMVPQEATFKPQVAVGGSVLPQVAVGGSIVYTPQVAVGGSLITAPLPEYAMPPPVVPFQYAMQPPALLFEAPAPAPVPVKAPAILFEVEAPVAHAPMPGQAPLIEAPSVIVPVDYRLFK